MTLLLDDQQQGELGRWAGYRVEQHPIESPREIERDWLDLQERAECSYFQSWGWISNWLQQVAAGLNPWVIRVWYGGALVGIGTLVRSHLRRHGVVRSDAAFLNEYPIGCRNMVIEYNGLLAHRGHEDGVYSAAISYLLAANRSLDELFLGALRGKELMTVQRYHDTERESGARLKCVEASPAWSVDLEQFGQGLDTYLQTLSKNRRAQLRRALRLYEAGGPVWLEEAQSPEQALNYFDRLGQFHTERWRRKGQSGSFANPLWKMFHKSLIRSRFGVGETQLLCASNAVGAIGYLYNIIWRKRVYVLQTGFKVPQDKRLMPGYVTHALAIVRNKQKGMHVYDLMHGDALYKRMLCNRTETLHWLVLQRRRLKFRLEDLAVKAVRVGRRSVF